MGVKMSHNGKYIQIGIPEDLISTVEKLIKDLELGYRNRTEFIIEAVRDKVSKLKNTN